VDVASNFSAPHANANNHDLALNVSNNSSQINENSAKTYAPLEYNLMLGMLKLLALRQTWLH
jgi:hypothetical protein